MNAYRHTKDGSLDRQMLRVSATYRLLRQRRIDKARAIELLTQKKVTHATAVVEQWLEWPLSERGRRNRAATQQLLNPA